MVFVIIDAAVAMQKRRKFASFFRWLYQQSFYGDETPVEDRRKYSLCRFRVVEHGMAAEEYAVRNIVEGKIEESVCQIMGVLLEKHLISLERRRRKIDGVITFTHFFGLTWHTSTGE